MQTHKSMDFKMFRSDPDNVCGSNIEGVCSLIPGTICEGMINETFIKKFDECDSCGFYQKMKEEEKERFISRFV